MSIVSAASLCHPRECATLNVVTASQPANEIDEAFQFFDANADGVLTTKEFSTMVRPLETPFGTTNFSYLCTNEFPYNDCDHTTFRA